MFRTIVFSAFGAALAIALVVSALQFLTTEPLILQAERFEGGGHDHDQAALPLAHASPQAPIPPRSGKSVSMRSMETGGVIAATFTPPASARSGRASAPSPRGEGLVHVDTSVPDFRSSAITPDLIPASQQAPIPPRDGEGGSALRAETGGAVPAALIHVHSVGEGEDEWAPADGIERSLYTVLANLVIGFAGSLMLLGAMMVKGETIDARRGLLWGFGAFAALSLLPSLGLPPELPGTPAAELAERQMWWLGTAAASAFGIGLLAYGGHWGWRIAGLALLVAPHAVGAPVPPSHDVAYPGALAGEFVAASLVVSLILWSLAGLVGGALHQRLSRDAG